MADVQHFRKKPIEIEAVRWTGDDADLVSMLHFAPGKFDVADNGVGRIYDELHKTWVNVYSGQWVIKGVKGEFYPIAADVLAETYEAVG